jgi:hypothetical protein
MSHIASQVRIMETSTDSAWPTGTRDVSHVGDACVVHGIGDFDLDDLDLVRRQFPDRRVTLDGDVITVWPPSSTTWRDGTRRSAPAYQHPIPQPAVHPHRHQAPSGKDATS